MDLGSDQQEDTATSTTQAMQEYQRDVYIWKIYVIAAYGSW